MGVWNVFLSYSYIHKNTTKFIFRYKIFLPVDVCVCICMHVKNCMYLSLFNQLIVEVQNIQLSVYLSCPLPKVVVQTHSEMGKSLLKTKKLKVRVNYIIFFLWAQVT